MRLRRQLWLTNQVAYAKRFRYTIAILAAFLFVAAITLGVFNAH